MGNVLMFVLPLILLCTTSFASRVQNQDAAVIDKFISKQESRESGYEYKDARKVIAGDLNRDGVPILQSYTHLRARVGDSITPSSLPSLSEPKVSLFLLRILS